MTNHLNYPHSLGFFVIFKLFDSILNILVSFFKNIAKTMTYACLLLIVLSLIYLSYLI